jgi:TolA-binding protein
MDKSERHQLKHDPLVDKMEEGLAYASTHQKAVAISVIGGLVTAAAIWGGLYFLKSRSADRAEALNAAIRVVETKKGPSADGKSTVKYGQGEDDKLAAAAGVEFRKVIAQYPGTKEAGMASFYLAGQAAAEGKMVEAEKHYRDCIANASSDFASMAKLPLADLLAGSGKAAEAETLIRGLIDTPTTYVSKKAATVELGRLLARSKPAEARKLLEPLRLEPGAVGRVATDVLNEIPVAN